MHAEISASRDPAGASPDLERGLDQLYEKLGKMSDASPEAREVWLEIQRRKIDITEHLSGIQVRPQSRPTVVAAGTSAIFYSDLPTLGRFEQNCSRIS